MNREEQLNKTFPLEDGTTYIQSIDKSNQMANFIEWMRINDTPENAEKYFHYTDEDMFNEYQNELKGAGVGGESLEENFIDSSPNSLDSSKSEELGESKEQDKLNKIYEKLDRDFMYNWIREKSGK
jgi:hypothetical protein